ncbi:sugar transporter, putative [Talaromyces stipitatus ATCC 10500]|uniref:Sugar transporter, putative n=1 Tax=Talaromyces stipitatus (strain ATCC 10500 / CBS 375.48 / QM 6759 / NRRL 1006) TaxID=441959 RepID=B8MJL6_TALSN|nr:sugar transporter, putative [Talaromyces stipitatus ATCC 10500]EED15216.1 sugar transporter, putative [Talaromyces stipitatus ATCC 10500]
MSSKYEHFENKVEEQLRSTTDDHPLGEKGGWHASVADAHLANINEHETTVRKALRAYPYAAIWSVVVSMSIIMEGYDTSLVGNFYGYPEFAKQFGSYDKATDSYQVAGQWQQALGSSPTASALVSATLNGYLLQRFEFRSVFMGGLVCMNAFIFICFFGTTVELQIAGQFLCGPMAFRPYLTAYTNMRLAIGQFIIAGVLQSLLGRPDQWSYRIPYAIQWLWPAPLMVAAFFMPESPWWLVRHNRYEEAEHSGKRLMARAEKPNARKVVAMMIHTNMIEKEITAGHSYWDCFRGTDLRRTEIACVIFAGQVLAGTSFAFSGTYFFEQAGLNNDDAYKLGLGETAIAFVGTLISWVLMRIAGRRTIYLWGMAGMCACLIIIGFLTLAHGNAGIKWAQSVLCVIWLFFFSLSAGPIGWDIPAEVSSTRLRSKTICLARNSYYITQIVGNVVEPYMLNSIEWNWRGKTGFFWFGTAFLTFVWACFRLPETKGRTYEELDLMFAAKVPTRKFRKFQVDAYDENVNIIDRVKETQ